MCMASMGTITELRNSAARRNLRAIAVTHWRVFFQMFEMYCRTLTYRDVHSRFSIAVEEQPDGSLQLWELDVPGGEMRRRFVIDKVANSLAQEGRQLRVIWGAARVERKRAGGPSWS